MIRLTQHRRVVFSRCYQLACLVFLIFFIVVIAGCAEKKVESPPPPPILVTPTPGPEVILRLHGSNALATKLIPDLAEAFLKKNGADNIVRLTES